MFKAAIHRASQSIVEGSEHIGCLSSLPQVATESSSLKSRFASDTPPLKFFRLIQEVKTMFHTYFGVFDFVCYAFAIIFVLYLASDAPKVAADERSATVSTPSELETSHQGVIVLNAPLYELRGHLVVMKRDIPANLSQGITSYTLRGEPAIRICDILKNSEIALAAYQVIERWSQSRKSQKRKSARTKRSQKEKALEKAALNGGSGNGITSTTTLTA